MENEMTTASPIIHQLRASYAFMERNANLVKRYWTWELVWMVYSIANSLSVSGKGRGTLMARAYEGLDTCNIIFCWQFYRPRLLLCTRFTGRNWCAHWHHQYLIRR